VARRNHARALKKSHTSAGYESKDEKRRTDLETHTAGSTANTVPTSTTQERHDREHASRHLKRSEVVPTAPTLAR
jgi:hypothetical protein